MGWVSSSPTPLRGDSEDWEERRIQQVVDAFVHQHPPIPTYDTEDLYQEGRLAWHRARETYRPDRGASLSTYFGSVVENRLRDLAREARAGRRWSPRGALSLDASIGDDGDPLADFLQDDAPDPAVEAERGELLERIARVRRHLPRRQRDVLDALAEDRPRAGIARDLGISRDTLYEDIRRIQDACRDAGLEDLLR